MVEVTQGSEQYVLCGDECYTFYNLKNQVVTGSCSVRKRVKNLSKNMAVVSIFACFAMI